ncbi:putative Cyclin C-terminal domain-containing protein [Seiridium cardinale]|uniref:Cyclin C-terminal domain-containing protein n=1 Tax=Seiridium cardinale TaxID=138064 RepID=A0ABR2Y327_9PEZI
MTRPSSIVSAAHASSSLSPSNATPNSLGHVDAPMRARFPAKLHQSGIDQITRLGRFWYTRWIHPQRKIYIHAFVDATICWFMVVILLYINNLQAVARWLDFEDTPATFFRAHAASQPIIAVAVGIAFGCLFKTIGDCKELKTETTAGKMKKYVVLARLRIPPWLYLCITFVTTFVLSFVATGGLKNMVWIEKGNDQRHPMSHYLLRIDLTWYSIVTTICVASVAAVTAGAIIRHRLLVKQNHALLDGAGSTAGVKMPKADGYLTYREKLLLAVARSSTTEPINAHVSKMATEDARYRASTQYRLWSFTPPQLSSLRNDNNNLAKAAISARLQASNPPVDPLPEFLTPAEELSLLTFYTVELLRAAAFLELPTEIRATAAIFLRRFYVTNSIMTYPPTELLKTCLFFGCKADGYYMRLSKFADKFPNTSAEVVLAAEYVLCQGIRFAFDVKHPFRALEGTIMELRRLGDFETKRIDRGHALAREILKFSPIVTDAYFHYTPSQIMLAALAIADEGLAQRLLRDAFAGQGEAAKDQVWNVIQSCRDLLEKEPPKRMTEYWSSVSPAHKRQLLTCSTDPEQPETSKAMKPLVRKLKKCRDPDRVDLVALQKARREQTEKKKPKPALKDDAAVFGGALGEPDAKRRKTVTNGDDPFGPALG